MGRENAGVAHAINIELLQASGEALLQPSFKQAERQQRRVPLVHVVSFNLPRINLLQKQEAAESEHDFLRQAVALVAAV